MPWCSPSGGWAGTSGLGWHLWAGTGTVGFAGGAAWEGQGDKEFLFASPDTSTAIQTRGGMELLSWALLVWQLEMKAGLAQGWGRESLGAARGELCEQGWAWGWGWGWGWTWGWE